MKTFLSVFNTFPAVLNAVLALENAIPVSGAGKQKLNLVLGADTTLNAINAITLLTVAGLNTAGVFRKSSPVPVPPVSSN